MSITIQEARAIIARADAERAREQARAMRLHPHRIKAWLRRPRRTDAEVARSVARRNGGGYRQPEPEIPDGRAKRGHTMRIDTARFDDADDGRPYWLGGVWSSAGMLLWQSDARDTRAQALQEARAAKRALAQRP